MKTVVAHLSPNPNHSITALTGFEPMEKRGITFNDMMMVAVSIPLILSWIIFACVVIWAGIQDESGFIQENLDFYVSLIAIIGGPALLFISSILEAWKTENAAELSSLPDRLALDLKKTELTMDHEHHVADAKVTHELEQAALRQKHELSMDAWVTTHGESESEE